MAVNEHFHAWLERLRSGEVEQGSGYLHQSYVRDDGTQVNEMCCLGVCSALHADKLKIHVETSERTVRYNNMASYPELRVLQFMGIPDSHIEEKSLGCSVLVSINDGLMENRITDFDYFKGRNEEKISVDILNDNGFSFAEIADLLEKEFVNA